jgi:hypothetical protein
MEVELQGLVLRKVEKQDWKERAHNVKRNSRRNSTMYYHFYKNQTINAVEGNNRCLL